MSKKVLIVEDNELNLKLFTDLLRAHQFEVEGVRDGREAFARMRAFVPDLVIMDIQMPHVSGLELIEAARLFPVTADRIAPTAAPFTGAPAKAPFRSTRCSHLHPAASNAAACAPGSVPNTVAVAMSPRSRRTQAPSFRSIAG